MLTNCGCIANKEQTEIIAPCLLHEAWRRQREREGLEKMQALIALGERAIDASAGKGAR